MPGASISDSKNRHARNVALSALVLAAVLAAFAVAFFALAWMAGRDAPVQQEGGTTVPAIEDVSDSDPLQRTAPTVEAPGLVGLLGLSRSQALAAIGHGAAVHEDAPGVPDDARDAVVVALAGERARDVSTAPRVYLWLDGGGKVKAARYAAALRSYGFSNRLAFSQAIDGAHVVELALADAGVELAPGTVRAPWDRAAYSTYRDDGRTLEAEHAEFSGDADGLSWHAALDYDYAEANSTGNLAYTHRTLSIGVSSSPST